MPVRLFSLPIGSWSGVTRAPKSGGQRFQDARRVGIPGRTGQQWGRICGSVHPEIVVLVTSGYSNPQYEMEAPESRTYFLAKPYSRRALVETIEKIFCSGGAAAGGNASQLVRQPHPF